MKARLFTAYFIFLPCVFTFLSCKNTFTPTERFGKPWYFNSFESPADTAGWRGNDGIILKNDVPPNGGKQSAYVSGGCDVPHALLKFTPVVKDRYFVLRCWGKNLAIGGSVSLSVTSDWQKSIYIGVRDSSWTFYETADTLYVPANQSMSLQLNAGGFVASAMLVDLLEIELVKVQR